MGTASSRVTDLFRREQPQRRETDPDALLCYSSTIGSFFGSHFLMGGERYELAKPEAYLFGENSDLDLLGNRATTFPYARQPVTDHVRPLNLFVNIRKETVKFVRLKNDDGIFTEKYRLEFTFDADCACCIQLHFDAREVYRKDSKDFHFIYKTQKPVTSEQFHFEAGAGHIFNNFIFHADDFDLNDMHYEGGQLFPVVIALSTSGVESEQMQCTMCTVELANDHSGGFSLKPLRQRVASDGVVYLLQEIFGLENKEHSENNEDTGFECIICMTEVRDTLILPCRHLCICAGCAENLRFKLNNCPICRSPFRALLTVKALRQAGQRTDSHNRTQPRYETLTIVEALNGPLNHQPILGDEPSPKNFRINRAALVNAINEIPVETQDGIELKDAKLFVHKMSIQDDSGSEKELDYASAEDTSTGESGGRASSSLSGKDVNIHIENGAYSQVIEADPDSAGARSGDPLVVSD
ncbi:unnamed protein product, partial [Mesorhabditis belari]|uniref:RING-type E3 ubiquitin transferase n=1 Tax=Mesorhabditis belari TaxID=2138241 RepID=A0AAF3EEH8_9BILA